MADSEPFKTYQVRRKHGVQTKKTVKVMKAELTKFRVKLHVKFPDIPTNKLCFAYKLKKKGSSTEEYVVETDDKNDSLEDFYTMTANMSEVLVYTGKKAAKREKRKCEVAGDKLKKSPKHDINPEKYYDLLKKNTDVACTYVKKKTYVQYLLGQTTVCNLLNPYKATSRGVTSQLCPLVVPIISVVSFTTGRLIVTRISLQNIILRVLSLCADTVI